MVAKYRIEIRSLLAEFLNFLKEKATVSYEGFFQKNSCKSRAVGNSQSKI